MHYRIQELIASASQDMLEKAKSGQYTPISIDADTQSAVFYHRKETEVETIKTTLLYCPCPQCLYSSNKTCVHMVRLALELDPAHTITLSSNIDETISALYTKDKVESVDAVLNRSHFGCCSSFNRCSDLGHCLYSSDHDFYTKCLYNKNLLQGRIFYGRHKNYPKQIIETSSSALSFTDFCNSLKNANSTNLPNAVTIHHDLCGDIRFDVINVDIEENARIATLCSSQALPLILPFDTPKDREPDNLPKNRRSYPGDARLYGSNSWYRSDLRRYLNSYSDHEPCCGINGAEMPGFLRGFSLDVLNCMIPSDNLSYIGSMPSPTELLYPVCIFNYDGNATVIKEYDANGEVSATQTADSRKGIRRKVTITKDYIWIPSVAELGLHHPTLATLPVSSLRLPKGAKLLNGRPTHVRLRDAAVTTSNNYSTAIYTESGSLGDCNANMPLAFQILMRIRLPIY